MPTYRVGNNIYAVVNLWGQHSGGAVNTAGTSYGAQVPWLPRAPIKDHEALIVVPEELPFVPSPEGTSAAGASAHGSATLIASPVGRCVAGASTNGVAAKIASSSGVCIAGASANGVAAKIAATSGVCVGGSLARGVAAKIVSLSGTSVAGSLAQGVATHIGIPISRSVAGASTQGSAAGIHAPIGSSVAGALTYGTATSGSAPTPIGRSVAGASAQGTATHVAIPSGTSVAGSLTYGVTGQPLPPISVSGVCAAGASSYGTAAQGGDVVMDTQVIPLAQALRDCLCAWTSVNPNPPGLCCFRVGTEIAHDASLTEDICCEGMAYVSIGNLWPSTDGFPADDVRQNTVNCFPPAWAVELRAGIIRCVPTGTLETVPTCPEWAAAHEQVAHDSQALRKAACCIRAFVQNNSNFLGMSMNIGRQTQINPLGGCVERYMIITVQIPNLDCGC